MIRIKQLTKLYGEKAVYRQFDFEIEEGKVTCVLGKSGAGKSTLLNVLAGLIPYEGTVEGQGRVSYVFQEPRLVPTLTVEQNLIYAACGRASKEEIAKILTEVELSDAAKKYPCALSGGMAQRVSVARAFLVKADTVLFDEPFRAMDIGLRERMLNLFFRLRQENPSTTVYVTHDPAEAVACGDRIVVIDGSRTVFDRSNSPTFSLTDADSSLEKELLQALVSL